MNTSLNRPDPSFAFRAVMKAVACLWCLGLLSSCDNKQDEPPNLRNSASPAQAKRPERPANLSYTATLDSVTQEIKAVGGDWNVRADAIKVVKEIGKQKQVDAIPSLLDGMFIIQPFSINNALDYEETYPCSAALVQIGEPAAPHIQSRFLAATSNHEQIVLLDTLLKIKGTAFVAGWIDSLPKSGARLLPEQRRAELKQWVLSQAH